MVKFYCDRCQKEEKRSKVLIITTKLGNTEDKGIKHLCSTCSNLFTSFMSGAAIPSMFEVDESEEDDEIDEDITPDDSGLSEQVHKELDDKNKSGNPVVDSIRSSFVGSKPENTTPSSVDGNDDVVEPHNWKMPDYIARRLESFMGNKISTEEYNEIAGKSKIDPDLKACIVNLWLNGMSISDVTNFIRISYQTVNQTIAIFRRKAMMIPYKPQQQIDVENLLRVKWKIQDIAADQSIPVSIVVAIYVRNMEGNK